MIVAPCLVNAVIARLLNASGAVVKLDKIDAWKECFALCIATHHAIEEPLKQREDDVLRRLDYAAIRAGGRVAFGVGSGDRKLRRIGTGQAISFLHEYGFVLELAQDRRLLDRDTCEKLESLRGRALFYTRRLWEETLGPPPAS